MPGDAPHQAGKGVGARLRAARLEKKYTQNQLAQPDFSVSYISAIERGQIQPSLRALEILARRLELRSTDLLPPPGQLPDDISPASGQTMPDEERELLFLEAQIAIHQGKSEQAIEILQALPAHRGERRWRRTLCYVLGWACLESGRLQESEQWLVEAARDATDPLYPLVLSLQNAVYIAMHNTEQAAQLRHTSLAFLEQPPASAPNIFFRARLYASLGQYYSHLGELEQAREMCTQALAILDSQHAPRAQLSTCWQLLCAYRERGEHQLATLYSQRWLLLELQTRLPTLRSEIQHALGHVLLKTNPNEAYTFFLNTFQEAAQRGDALSQASANVHLARWLLARCEFTEAEQHAREAQRLADPFGETLIAADAQFLLGKLAYRRQDYASGDRAFEASFALLEHLEEAEELAEHLAHYAGLLEDRGLVERSLLYWKRAFAYRQKRWPVSP